MDKQVLGRSSRQDTPAARLELRDGSLGPWSSGSYGWVSPALHAGPSGAVDARQMSGLYVAMNSAYRRAPVPEDTSLIRSTVSPR